jgi:CubicO group peptidase (beta-lactamase class C family)
MALVPLPSNPANHPWPTSTWAAAEMDGGDPDRLDEVLDRAFDHNPNRELALTLAVIVVQHGRIVAERYAPTVGATTPLISWSVAKSFTHAALGIAYLKGLVDLDATPVAPEWRGADDPRAAIRFTDLLAMRSGLEFNEDYLDDSTSHCLEMLFGAGAADMAHYAASHALIKPIDEYFNYSSGTTNIVSRAIGDAVGGGADSMSRFLRDELFDPIGMASAEPRFDEAGTWVGSSYLYATARDFARFGELVLRDGVWDGRRILPEGWIDAARVPRSTDEEDGSLYGLHWWVEDDDLGTFSANGYEGQRIVIVPALGLVLVRLGKTPATHGDAVSRYCRDLVGAFR